LTAIRTGGNPSFCQATFCRQAVFRTHFPTSMINPISSSKGINSIGEINPSCGWFQRSSASTPVMAPDFVEICGW